MELGSGLLRRECFRGGGSWDGDDVVSQWCHSCAGLGIGLTFLARSLALPGTESGGRWEGACEFICQISRWCSIREFNGARMFQAFNAVEEDVARLDAQWCCVCLV